MASGTSQSFPDPAAGIGQGVGASEHAQADTAGAQFVHGGQQMFQVTPQAVELPDDEGVARLQRLQAGLQARAVIQASRGAVFVEALLVNAGAEQGIALEVQELAAIRLWYSCIANQYDVRVSGSVKSPMNGISRCPLK